jgi:hypothetical protein
MGYSTQKDAETRGETIKRAIASQELPSCCVRTQPLSVVFQECGKDPTIAKKACSAKAFAVARHAGLPILWPGNRNNIDILVNTNILLFIGRQ